MTDVDKKKPLLEFGAINSSLIRKYLPVILGTGIFFILGLYISSISSDQKRVLPAIVIAGLFLMAILLILRTSFNLVNLTFASSFILYFIVALVAALTYFDPSIFVPETLWPILGVLYLIAPLGMYLSSKIMLKEIDDVLTSELFFIFLSTGFIATGSISFYNAGTISSVLFIDTLVIVLLLLITYQFFQVKKLSYGSNSPINYLLFGFIVAISGLILSNISILIGGPGEIRLIIPMIGMLFVVFSFIVLPTQHLSGDDNAGLEDQISHFVEMLDIAVPKLQVHFTSPDNVSLPVDLSLENNVNIRDNTIAPSVVSTTESINIIDLTPDQISSFKQHLQDEMNGLTISILIETSLIFPKGITNVQLRKKIKKSKTTIIDQTKKLISLGYMSKSINLMDTREKPLIITHSGFLFLYHLHQTLSTYLNREKTTGVYDLHEILNI